MYGWRCRQIFQNLAVFHQLWILASVCIFKNSNDSGENKNRKSYRKLTLKITYLTYFYRYSPQFLHYFFDKTSIGEKSKGTLIF